MGLRNKRSIAGALAAAALFGASTPAAKMLGAELHPFALAGLLYAGSGIGITLWILARHLADRRPIRLGIASVDLPWLAGSVLTGGVLAPGLLMLGLVTTQATVASLLLNLESVFTALIAWFVFRENFDRRIALGMALITAGGVVLSMTPGTLVQVDTAALLVGAACLFWAIDNNLTRKISAGDPTLDGRNSERVACGNFSRQIIVDRPEKARRTHKQSSGVHLDKCARCHRQHDAAGSYQRHA